MQLPSTFLSGTVGTILAFSIGLLTNGAHAHFSEGRKLWCNVETISTRVAHNVIHLLIYCPSPLLMSTQLWFHVSENRDPISGPAAHDGQRDASLRKRLVDAKIEKKSMINLVLAYAIALKHALRGEPGAYYADLYPLVAWIPHFAGASSTQVTEADWMPIWAASRDIQFEDGKRPAMPVRGQYDSVRPSLVARDLRRSESDSTLNNSDLNRLNLTGRTKEFDIEAGGVFFRTL
jgi:hypothetical protein